MGSIISPVSQCDPNFKKAKCLITRQGAQNMEKGFCVQHTCVYNPLAKQIQLRVNYAGKTIWQNW